MMEKMKNFKYVFYGCICIVLTSCSGVSSFNGSRTGNRDQLIMEYSIFNSIDSQLLDLVKGDILKVNVESHAGEISAVIQKDNDIPLYEQEDIPTGCLYIEIFESGTYKVTVTGKRAQGSIGFTKYKSEMNN